MKQKRVEKLTKYGHMLLMIHILLGCIFFSSNMYPTTATYTGSHSGSDDSNITITTTWDDTVACQGSTTTIMYNVTLSAPMPSGAYPYYIQGFVPTGFGFACPVVTPPAMSGYDDGGFFEPFGQPIIPLLPNSCSSSSFPAHQTPTGCILNKGLWSLSDPFPTITGGYDMWVTVTLTECGVLSFNPCTIYGSDLSMTNCLTPAGITFVVVPHAELEDVAVGPMCQGSVFTGTLPPPICTAQAGYTCPTCVPCTACSNFTAITGCALCSGATSSCTCPCDACSGYTGCPPCTACAPCPGCAACQGYTGPCGPQPMNYVVGGAVGGTVTLINPTAGVFAFVPTSTFFGTASFVYNVQSDWSPIIFCPANTGGVYELIYAQNPIASNVSTTGCIGSTVTGSLVPFVTGGSGHYTFSQTGTVSCGSVMVNPNGNYIFSSPTGTQTSCYFVYAATDDAVPHCVGTGVVTLALNPSPVATDATIDTCVNMAVSGTVAATGGAAPYTFTQVTGPGFGPNHGTVMTAADFATSGNFTYTPDLDFTGMDYFTFSVTDANGCTNVVNGVETIEVDPIPFAGSTAVNGCTNTTLTGSLVPLVTGGTGAFVFGQGTTPTCGGVFITSDGDYTFSPNFGFTGVCCFTYTVSQGGCPATGPGTVCVNVQPGPIATGSDFNVCPSGTVTGNLNDNVINSSGTNTFVVTSTFGGFFNYFDSTTGDYSFTTTIASGNAGFTFYVSDAFPCPSATQTVLIDVHPKPTTTTGTIKGCSNTPINGNLNPQVTGDAPFTFTGPFTQMGGTTVIDTNGIFSFTPNPGATGGDFTYGVESAFGCTGTGEELIIVNPSPVAAGTTATGCAQEPLSGSLVPLVSGGTPPYVNFQLAGLPVNGTATVSSNGNYTFTPNAGATSGSFQYQVTDSNGCTAIGTVTVAVNPTPITMTGYFTGCDNGVEGVLLPLVSGGVLPYTFIAPVGTPFNGTVTLLDASNGTFIFVSTFPAPTQGSFNYEVMDSSTPPCTSKPTPVFVSIVEGPAANPASFTGCENQPFSGSLAPFVTGGMPPYSYSFTGTVPACASSIMITPDGEVIFVPALDFTGPCVFDYCVTDTIPCTDCSTVTVNVQQSPVATSSGPFTGCVGNPFIGNLNNFMASGTPPFSFTGGDAINGTLMLQVTGPFAFTPIAIGPASFEYSAVDFYGCQSNTGTISVNAQESPTITGTSPLDTCQGTPVTGTVTAAAPGDLMPLTFSIVPGSEVNGTATVTQTSPTTADFTFSPDVTAFPTPTIIGMVTIRVTASNGCYADFPVTIDIHQSPIAGSTGLGSCSPVFTGSLTGLVSGGVPPYTFSQFNGFIPPGCGTVAISPTGMFVYTASGTGPCTFFYSVTESSTGACSSTGAVTITTSIPPVVTNLVTCACYNVPVSINLNTLTSGGVPPYTFAIVGTPVGGTVFLNPITGIATFRPNPGFNGVGSFMFQAFDSFNPPCASNIGTVTIPVPCCP